MYFILEGRMRVHDGKNTIALLGEGEIIGEMTLLDPAPRSASVTSIQDSFLFRLEKEAFNVIMAGNQKRRAAMFYLIQGSFSVD